MADNLLETLLRLDVDVSSAGRAVAAEVKVKNAMDDLRIATAKLDASAKASIRTIQQQTDALEQNKRAIRDLAKERAAAAGDTGRIVGTSRLGRIGSELRMLPSIRIPGTATGTDAIANVVRLAGVLEVTLPKAAATASVALASLSTVGLLGVGAVGGAFVALAGILLALKSASDATRAAIEAQINKQIELSQFEANATRKQLEDLIKKNELEYESAQIGVAVAQQNLEDANKRLIAASANPFNIAEINDAKAAVDAAAAVREKELEAANKASDALIGLIPLRNSETIAINTLKAAEAELLGQRVNAQIQIGQQLHTLTEKQLDEQLTNLQETRRILVNATFDPKASEAQIEQWKKQISDLDTQINLLTRSRSYVQYRDELRRQEKILEETGKAMEKYDDAIARAEDNANQARIDAAEKYHDAVISIAEKAAEAAENALQKLEEKRASLALDLARAGEDTTIDAQRAELDAQIHFQREEAKAARDHLNNLRRIRREGQRDETTAIQNRDAVALDAAQQRKKDEIANENESYAQSERERRIAYQNELSDQRTQYDRERQDRYRKYERDLADAQAQYNRELAEANQNRLMQLHQAQLAYQQELVTINKKHADELKARKDAAVKELEFINKTEAEKLAILTDYYNRARALLSGQASIIPSAIATSGPGPYVTPPSLDTGGRITRTGLAMVHRGEEIRNPRRGQTGMTLNLNFSGMQEKSVKVTSRQQAIEIVTQAFERFGA